MFGFTRPRCPNTLYRQAYTRCCMHQHLHYGLTSLPFLSYEAVLLYLAACDARLISVPSGTPTCCRLSTSRRFLQQPDAPIAEFCASFGMLLVSIKLEDDVRDGGGWLAKLLKWKYRHATAKVHQYFSRLDPQFSSRVQQIIADHLALEKLPSPSLHEYLQPTAQAFGYVFSLLSRLPVAASQNRLSDCQPWLTELGHHVGASIIAFDCAVDWQRDQRSGAYNPLQSQDEAEQALQTCRLHLHQAVSSVLAVLGPNSQTAQLLEDRAAHLPSLQHTSACSKAWKGISQWDYLRQRRYVYAGDCGGCDCSGCDGCDACGGADGADCSHCGHCGGGGHDCSCVHLSCCDSTPADGHGHCNCCDSRNATFCDCCCEPCVGCGEEATKKKRKTDPEENTPEEPTEEVT